MEKVGSGINISDPQHCLLPWPLSSPPMSKMSFFLVFLFVARQACWRERGGGGKNQIIPRRESLVLYYPLNNLWVQGWPPTAAAQSWASFRCQLRYWSRYSSFSRWTIDCNSGIVTRSFNCYPSYWSDSLAKLVQPVSKIFKVENKLWSVDNCSFNNLFLLIHFYLVHFFFLS